MHQLVTVRPLVLKVGALLEPTNRRVWFHLLSTWPGRELFRRVSRPSRWSPTPPKLPPKTPTATPNEDCCGDALVFDPALSTQWCDTMKVRELLKLLKRDGWMMDRSRGSHRQFRHPTKSGTATVSGHPNDDVHPKTLKSVLRQADLEELS